MLITQCKVLCRPVDISIKSCGREGSSLAKKDYVSEYVKSSWKGSQIYRCNRSTTQNFIRRSTMVANIFEDFEPPSKKFLATPLNTDHLLWKNILCKTTFFKKLHIHSGCSYKKRAYSNIM